MGWPWQRHCPPRCRGRSDEQHRLLLPTVPRAGAAVTLRSLLCPLQKGDWAAEKVIEVPSKKVQGWLLPDMPGQSEELWEGAGCRPLRGVALLGVSPSSAPQYSAALQSLIPKRPALASYRAVPLGFS